MQRERRRQPLRSGTLAVLYSVLAVVVLLTIWGAIYLWSVLGSVAEWGM